jgi:hypothetical protein
MRTSTIGVLIMATVWAGDLQTSGAQESFFNAATAPGAAAGWAAVNSIAH